jgi:hypothetical protein
LAKKELYYPSLTLKDIKPKKHEEVKDYVKNTEENITANKYPESRLLSAIQLVTTYVEHIPEINVKFNETGYILSTSVYGSPFENVTIQQKLSDQMDDITKGIIENLKKNNIKSPKAERLRVEFDNMGMGFGGQRVLYVVKAYYALKADGSELIKEPLTNYALDS